MSVDGPAFAPVPIRQTRGGGTGHQTWSSAHLLASALLAMESEELEAQKLATTPEAITSIRQSADGATAGRAGRKTPKQPQRCILELGAGTGQLAVTLARAGWRGILATEGEPAVVRNMKSNVQANRLGHAVRCLRWQWEDPPPACLDLADVDLVIGSDLVYYNREHGMLASVLRTVLTSRSQSDTRRPVRALLLCCLRLPHDDGAGQVVHYASSDGYVGTAMQRFVEEELPSQSLFARQLPLPGEVFNALGDESMRDAFASMSARQAYQLYEVVVKSDALDT